MELSPVSSHGPVTICFGMLILSIMTGLYKSKACKNSQDRELEVSK